MQESIRGDGIRRRAAVEAAWGKPIETIIDELIAAGFTAARAAKELGVSTNTVSAWVKATRHKQWPQPDHQARAMTEANKARTVYFTVGDQRYSFKSAARAFGLRRNTIRQRYERGLRGHALVAPVEPDKRRDNTRRQRRGVWSLGLSERQWQAIADYAKERGASAAMHKYNAPKAAIEAAVAGDLYLLD